MSEPKEKPFLRARRPEIKPHLEHVKGNTWCIVTGYARIPLYKLDEHRVIMIDSGLPQSWDELLALLEREQLQVEAVLTSHAHPDHVGNHKNLREHFGADIYMSRFSAAIYDNAMNQSAISIGITGYRKYSKTLGRTFDADVIFDWDIKTIEVEDATFIIEQLPGHAAEHIGIVTPDNVAYLGDTVLDESMVRNIRLPFCTCLEPDLESLEGIAQMQYDKYILAHNGVYDSIREVALLNRDNLLKKADMIADLFDDYMTMDAAVKKLLLATGGDIDNKRTVSGTRYNMSIFITYLEDTDRLICRARDGALEYIRNQI